MGYIGWMSDPSGGGEASYKERSRATVDIHLSSLDIWGPEIGSTVVWGLELQGAKLNLSDLCCGWRTLTS